MNSHPCKIPSENPRAPGSPDGTAAEAENLAAEAHAAFLRGDLARARECLSAALELCPGHGELALALGHAEMSAGNLEAARAAYWNATLRSPTLAAAHSNHALVLLFLGRFHEASQDALRAVTLDTTDVVGLKVLARIHLKAGQHEAALQACQLVLEQDPRDGEALQMFEEARIQEAKLGEILPEKTDVRPAQAMTALPPRLRPPLATSKHRARTSQSRL